MRKEKRKKNSGHVILYYALLISVAILIVLNIIMVIRLIGTKNKVEKLESEASSVVTLTNVIGD